MMIETKIDNLNIAIHFDISVERLAALLQSTPDEVQRMTYKMIRDGDDTLLDELNQLDLAALVQQAVDQGDPVYVEEVQI